MQSNNVHYYYIYLFCTYILYIHVYLFSTQGCLLSGSMLPIQIHFTNNTYRENVSVSRSSKSKILFPLANYTGQVKKHEYAYRSWETKEGLGLVSLEKLFISVLVLFSMYMDLCSVCLSTPLVFNVMASQGIEEWLNIFRSRWWASHSWYKAKEWYNRPKYITFYVIHHGCK